MSRPPADVLESERREALRRLRSAPGQDVLAGTMLATVEMVRTVAPLYSGLLFIERLTDALGHRKGSPAAAPNPSVDETVAAVTPKRKSPVLEAGVAALRRTLRPVSWALLTALTQFAVEEQLRVGPRFEDPSPRADAVLLTTRASVGALVGASVGFVVDPATSLGSGLRGLPLPRTRLAGAYAVLGAVGGLVMPVVRTMLPEKGEDRV